jgi:hypothetical protein
MILVNVLSRSLMVAAIFVLIVPRIAYSLSIYDVIMLSQKDYEADDIVVLIETTGSAFDLTAEDVTRLKEAGVSETVIQAMLAAVLMEPQENTDILPKPTANQRSQEADTSTETTGSIHPEKLSQPQIVIKKSQRGQSPPVISSGGVFTSMSVNEEGAGGHHHQAITFENIKLLILRDEGAYSSVVARAASVVRRLQEARSIGKGNFKSSHAGGGVHSVVFQTQDRREIVIISASGRDALAYQTRSGRHVNPDILADYWSDLLSDYWSIIFQATEPTRLNNLHEGEALQALSRQLIQEKNGDAEQLAEAVRSLPREVQKHLELLAATVPREFGSDSDHEAEEQ